jgi:hypothetical protein
MLGAIPNPKKAIIIERPIGTLKELLTLIPLINTKYKKTTFDDILNLYTFEALEFLSLGVFIDINLTSSGDNKTEISVEIRRKVGSFDQSHEVTAANKHIQVIFESISKSLQMSDEDVNQLKEQIKNTPVPAKGAGCVVFAIGILGIGVYLLTHGF